MVRDGELWQLWFTRVPSPETMAAEITRRLALQERGVMLPFTVKAAGWVAGMTTYCNIGEANKVLEISYTFLAWSHQGGYVNPEMKLDGILRRHTILPNGTVRDTCVYSLLDHEWENVRTGLEFRLQQLGRR
ncbi:MAG: hypothetical protein Q4D96_12535 [Propionibacteriaceae bacterium]|nr:hypothetical protein [Propionibacteriaceae bacterium]